MDNVTPLYTTIKNLIADLEEAQEDIKELEEEKDDMVDTIMKYQTAAEIRRETTKNLSLVTVEDILLGKAPTFEACIKDSWRAGKKIEGIKRLRAFTGKGLKECKYACDNLWDRWAANVDFQDEEEPSDIPF